MTAKLQKSRRLVVGFAFAAVSFIVPALSRAQSLTIRVLDAKSGKPLRGENITLLWGDDSSLTGDVLALDHEGKARVAVRPGATKFRLNEGPKRGDEPYRIAYLNCNDPDLSAVAVDEVLARGVVPSNKCGNRKTQVHAGEVVYWGLPRRWWQLDMQ